MAAALEQLEADPWVEAYAWWVMRTAAACCCCLTMHCPST